MHLEIMNRLYQKWMDKATIIGWKNRLWSFPPQGNQLGAGKAAMFHRRVRNRDIITQERAH